MGVASEPSALGIVDRTGDEGEWSGSLGTIDRLRIQLLSKVTSKGRQDAGASEQAQSVSQAA